MFFPLGNFLVHIQEQGFCKEGPAAASVESYVVEQCLSVGLLEKI